MLSVHSLLDYEAVDAWLRSTRSALEVIAAAPDGPIGDCGWLILRCEDTLRYDVEEVKYQSVLHLIGDLECFEEEHPRRLGAGVIQAARLLVLQAERRRYLNG